MIEIANLTKTFGIATAVDHLNLSIGAGELFAFIGPNGAGKTTTIKMVTGLLRPTEGQVHLCGYNVQTDYIRAKSLLSYVPDEPYLYDKLTGREFLRFVGTMYGLPRNVTDSGIAQLGEQFSLGDFLDELGETYSHGMKQRVVISAALLHGPKVLVVDEPLVGLDPEGASTLKGALRERAQQGVTVFISTHTLTLAEEIADRVGIIHHGRLIALGSLDHIRQEARTDGRLEDAFLTLTGEQTTSGSSAVMGA